MQDRETTLHLHSLTLLFVRFEYIYLTPFPLLLAATLTVARLLATEKLQESSKVRKGKT